MRIVTCLFFALIAASAQAADGARARLDRFAQGISSISADFTQQTIDANGSKARESRGTLALRAPRQFRWDVVAPYQQLIVADGEKVWVYDPDLEQVTVRPQGSEEAHSPLTVLTDLSQLDRDFAASEAGMHDGLTWLRLKSKDKEPQFAWCDLGFDANGLARMDFEDTLGNRTQISFTHWQRNPKLAAGAFQFAPPKGVDVIGDATPAAQAYPVR